MGRTILVFFERLLIAVVSLVIAAIVVTLFFRALRGPEQVVTTVGGDGEAVAAGTEVTTTAFVPITFPDGPCVEDLPTPSEELMTLTVFFTCGSGALPTGDAYVYRRAPSSSEPFASTLKELLEGPSSRESELGFRSVFNVTTAGTLEATSVAGGEAVIDFESLPAVTGLSPVDDIAFFVANLNANVFQFPGVDSVEYRLEGSCAAFWEHLGDDTGCRIIARENHEATMAANRGE